MTPIEEIKSTITRILKLTEREGIDNLLAFMEEGGFFIAPASTRFHGAYEGGLAEHSLDVYYKFNQLNESVKLDIPNGSPEIACLLHDLCKIGCYYLDVKGYKTVKPSPQGHGVRSFELAKQFISMSLLESNMIIYHMGVYGLKEYEERSGEYPLRGGGLANVWANYPACKLIYFADELVTMEERNNDHQQNTAQS